MNITIKIPDVYATYEKNDSSTVTVSCNIGNYHVQNNGTALDIAKMISQNPIYVDKSNITPPKITMDNLILHPRKRLRPEQNNDIQNSKKILTELVNNLVATDKINSTKENKTDKCPNPLCDHVYTNDYTFSYTKDVSNITDLINIGKSYHCQNNIVYKNINLKVLCKLVPSLTELSNLVGMNNVKESIFDHIIYFLQGLHKKSKCKECCDCYFNLPCVKNNTDMLHIVITGPPGVGKTELGKILGKVYNAMGVLETDVMHIATRSDLIGQYLGQTAIKTQQFINKCKGGVMFIDEAYSLGNENKDRKDNFAKECIDTINQNLTEKRDFLLIIAGYADALEKCFFSQNEGLHRRFPFRYNIDGYSYDELREIFLRKVVLSDWICNVENSILDNFFKKHIESFKYFGGDVETLLMHCKVMHARRIFMANSNSPKCISIEDIQKGYNVFEVHRQIKEKDEIPDFVKHLYI